MNIITSNLGYPRIGGNREWKKLLESFWSGKLPEESFLAEMKKLRLQHLQKQKDMGIELIPVGDFTFYDHMLDTAAMFGLVPERFDYSAGPVSLETYYAMARGNRHAAACEMTKWFNTNYHYIVPEWEGAVPVLAENRPLEAYREAKRELGIEGKPVLIGPFTFLKLSKGYTERQFPYLLETLSEMYGQILRELEQEGVRWVQMDEPSLVTDISTEEFGLVETLYKQLRNAAPNLSIMLQTYFDAADQYERLIKLPVKGIGLDFVHGKEQNLRSIMSFGFPSDKILGLGLIDGRNIWRTDVNDKLTLFKSLAAKVSPERWVLQPSCSLLHVPVSLTAETKLPPLVKNALAFADEKLQELVHLAKLISSESGADPLLTEDTDGLAALNQSPLRNISSVKQEMACLSGEDSKRSLPFAARQKLQQQKWQLPLLPTTSIGSFPQTAEVRQARQQWRKGDWNEAQYKQFIRDNIAKWIGIQEQIGLDVLVHGEFERTDMVEFFGEKLAGFAFTRNGWVQSYGSRCVKPPVIYGDVEFVEPITVDETVYAQSLSEKPVKGMLTGPITILNWSFVRDDISRKEVAYQIALALRKEVAALETSGIEMIQVDEPALREGLPLKRRNWNDYLDWAVEAFRVATSSVKDTTQIHTHMCYCEFQDIMQAIENLDADVISIETSRSHGELISFFEKNSYDKGIGLGVYDIHSPRIPSVDEMLVMITRALRVLPDRLFWINPDCGLKTRGEHETVESLKNMVLAAHEARKNLRLG